MNLLVTFCYMLLSLTYAEAQSSLELTLNKAKKGRLLNLSLVSDSLAGCEISISADTKNSRLESGAGELLAMGESESQVINFIASKLKPLFGNGKLKLFFQGRANCDQTQLNSPVRKLVLKRRANGSIKSGKQWLGQLKKQIAQASSTLTPVFSSLSFESPLLLQNAGDGSDRIFVVEQKGKIKVFENSDSVQTSKEFLNITQLTEGEGERGLLGLAFDPNYKQTGYFYVNYTDKGGDTQVVRYKASSNNPNLADPSSAFPILSVPQPYSNHNGGNLAFGPDGYLYIALGDGGYGGDPQKNGENITVLLGKILRIDVSGTSGSTHYKIPIDNPFVGNSIGAKTEIFAWGVRNPWRFSFDSSTGLLWAADVGQDRFEEVDIVRKGKNYGWNTMEGNECFEPETGCNQVGLELPVAVYDHSVGQSITGGYVYRGSKVPALFGRYVFGDFGSGRIFSMPSDLSSPYSELMDTDYNISSFGIDEHRELYLVDYGGKIFRFS